MIARAIWPLNIGTVNRCTKSLTHSGVGRLEKTWFLSCADIVFERPRRFKMWHFFSGFFLLRLRRCLLLEFLAPKSLIKNARVWRFELQLRALYPDLYVAWQPWSPTKTLDPSWLSWSVLLRFAGPFDGADAKCWWSEMEEAKCKIQDSLAGDAELKGRAFRKSVDEKAMLY